MSRYGQFDILAGSAVVGLLELYVGLTIGMSSAEPLHYVIAAQGIATEVAVMLCLLSALTIYGSVKPKRNCRHLGLTMSVMVLLAVLVMLVSAGWFSFGAGVVFVLALSALGLYAADAHIHVNERRRLHAEGP